MMNLNQLIKMIRDWANQRNLINGATSISQHVKLVSELGEIGEEIFVHRDYALCGIMDSAVRSKYAIKDGIGDCMVVLTIIAAQEGYDAEDLLDGDTYEANPAIVLGEFLQLVSCFGRLGDALLKRDQESIKMFLITSLVILRAFAEAEAVQFEECVMQAYNEIKDRQGVMYNGTFIKSSDPSYLDALSALALEQ